MVNMINGAQTVGEIVAIMPEAGELFKQFRIDFCCGGGRLLSDVVREQNLNEGEVLSKLNVMLEESGKAKETGRAKESGGNFLEMSRGELIDHIINVHHAYVKKTLPVLGELTTKIMKVHGLNHEELFKVHKLFSALRAELEQHLLKEEEILFPSIREYDGKPDGQSLARIKQVIEETEDEHEAAGGILKELRRITKDYKVPEDGCNTYYMTFRGLEELEADLFRHIHLENNILFKKLMDI